MNTEQTVKRGRGRPVNSVSFTNITLAELNARFGQDQVLPVGRIFLEKGGVSTQPIKIISTNNQPRVVGLIREDAPNTPKVEMTLLA